VTELTVSTGQRGGSGGGGTAVFSQRQAVADGRQRLSMDLASKGRREAHHM
jgi:hypothetical protein